jgi:hypothetical protein
VRSTAPRQPTLRRPPRDARSTAPHQQTLRRPPQDARPNVSRQQTLRRPPRDSRSASTRQQTLRRPPRDAQSAAPRLQTLRRPPQDVRSADPRQQTLLRGGAHISDPLAWVYQVVEVLLHQQGPKRARPVRLVRTRYHGTRHGSLPPRRPGSLRHTPRERHREPSCVGPFPSSERWACVHRGIEFGGLRSPHPD